ncbi:MAG: FAD-dependent oxidoreductase [Hyphomicrobiaceae bacterium]
MTGEAKARFDIAVIGSGISGLSAAWLLSRAHSVTLYESESRIGGHSHTVDAIVDGRPVPVDTGFIVYNEPCYPNLTALLDHLNVATVASNMSFAVSMRDGATEYSGESFAGLLARPGNVLSRRFWSMLRDILRFYREAPRLLERPSDGAQTLGDYLAKGRYGQAFREDHLLPMAGAIWSASPGTMLAYPARAFVQFFVNHGLLKLRGRPIWRTVSGGSRAYVERLMQAFNGNVLRNKPVVEVRRSRDGVWVRTGDGDERRFDHVVIAAHADQALAMLADADADELRLLGGFEYTANEAWLHQDRSLMPRRRAAWASWNYLGQGDHRSERAVALSYWMNRLQPLGVEQPIFVTLNPAREPDPDTVHWRGTYYHPVFNAAALGAQRELWSLQGRRRTWFCGAYFGAGFHEDGLQAGLAVAEQLGGVKRPWDVAGQSDRIIVREPSQRYSDLVAI